MKQLYVSISRSANDILYHVTGVSQAQSILESGRFELVNTVFGQAETEVSGNYAYFLSCARSLTSVYVKRYMGYEDTVLLVLDGSKLSAKNKIVPTNYWGGSSATSDEMEDRVLSNNPFIPATCIKAIYFMQPESAHGANFAKAALKWKVKTKGKVGIFPDLATMRTLNLRKANAKLDTDVVARLLGEKAKNDNDPDEREYQKSRQRREILRASETSTLRALVEAINQPVPAAFSPATDINKAQRMLLQGATYAIASRISAELQSNKTAKYSQISRDREHVNTVTDFMQKNKMTVHTLAEFLDFKWKTYPFFRYLPDLVAVDLPTDYNERWEYLTQHKLADARTELCRLASSKTSFAAWLKLCSGQGRPVKNREVGVKLWLKTYEHDMEARQKLAAKLR